jgi:dihydrofolate reductase
MADRHRLARATAEGFGAFILGRNMFGPAGDDWGGPGWKGWWGDNPPYHAPTFILTTTPGANRDGGRDDLMIGSRIRRRQNFGRRVGRTPNPSWV